MSDLSFDKALEQYLKFQDLMQSRVYEYLQNKHPDHKKEDFFIRNTQINRFQGLVLVEFQYRIRHRWTMDYEDDFFSVQRLAEGFPKKEE